MKKLSKEAIDLAKNALQTNNYYHDVSFHALLTTFKIVLDLSEHDFAVRFGTTEERVRDWLNGIHMPPVGLRSIFIEWFEKKLSEAEKESIF